ncbi:MAG: transposase [Clostridia bacterium]|nr:transposase [Clostridia bacterium]
MENELITRKRNRLKNYDYSSSGAYFITICTKDRKNIFWAKDQTHLVGDDIVTPKKEIELSHYGRIAEIGIKMIPICYPNIELKQYVVMPNHIHMILFIPYDNGIRIHSTTSIPTIVGQTKRHIAKEIGSPIWQRSFHDHIIRNKEDYEKIAKYIHENPLRWQYDCFYNKDT